MVWTTILQKLTQPFPLHDAQRWGGRMALLSGLFVLLFLYFLQPFGVRVAEGQQLEWLKVSAEFGLVTVAVTLLWRQIDRAFPRIFQEEKWQVWKEIVLTLVFVGMIATANMFYAVWRFGQEMSWYAFFAWQFTTWTVAVFPTVIGVMTRQIRLMSRYASEADEMTRTLHLPAAHPAQPLLEFAGENQGERLKVRPDDLLYLEAADNYVQFCFEENGALKQRLMRGALRRFEAVLSAYPRFYRCHRTYIVNLDRVERISGNAQGYKLHLRGAEQPVPVSRSLNEEMRARLDS
ncbi:MAG: LytTR family DNA-binding domain-containing protein [Saprospiraceae bacterium]|nr:LytTR family DNA-binding domain-containing protein [Saprospiraceae bacterium]